MPFEGARIEFERSGGFAGISLGTSVDTSQLSPDEAREMEELLAKVNFSAPRELPMRASRGADRFQYNLTVTRGGQTQTVSIGESEVTPELRPLLDRLTDMAKRR